MVKLENATTRGHGLARVLTNRQLQLIAIGGTIGTSLFLGSAKTISSAGPIIVLAYLLAGIVMFVAMRVLGEMILTNTDFRSFRDIATSFLGPWGGFFVGWMYWMFWITTGMQDCVAVSVYLEEYLPYVPKWLPGLCVVLFIFVLNSLTVKLFGELEFWLSIIKIITICVLIVAGFYLIFSGITYSYNFNVDGDVQIIQMHATFSNLIDHGGFMPKGFIAFIFGFQFAFIAYAGVESIGTAVAETKDVEKTLPKAINAIPMRIGIFYVGAIFVIMCIVPWDKLGELNGSPFVNAFSTIGIPSAGLVMTFVLITAAVSGANSGLYSTSRMLFGLSADGQAPKLFEKISLRKVPQNALSFGVIVIAIPVIIVSFLEEPMDAFTIFASWATGCFLVVWIIMFISYFQYRKNFNNLHISSKFKVPFGKISVVVALIFFMIVIVVMMLDSVALLGFILSILTLIVLGVIYKFIVKKNEHIVDFS